jgi:hypothetical protein
VIKSGHARDGFSYQERFLSGTACGTFSSRGVHGRPPPRYSEAFDHPDIAVGDLAQYGKVAAVR